MPIHSHCHVQPSSPWQEAGQPSACPVSAGWWLHGWPARGSTSPENRHISCRNLKPAKQSRYNQKTYPGGRSEGGGRSHEGSKDASLHLGDRSGVYSLESSNARHGTRRMRENSEVSPFEWDAPFAVFTSSVNRLKAVYFCVSFAMGLQFANPCYAVSVNPAKLSYLLFYIISTLEQLRLSSKRRKIAERLRLMNDGTQR